MHALDQVVHFDVPASVSGRPRAGGRGQVVQQPAGPGHRGAGGGARPTGVRRPPLGHGPALPLPGGQRPGGRPAAGRPGLARHRPLRPAIDVGRRRRPAGRARLPGLLPAGPGHLARRPDQPTGARRPLVPGQQCRVRIRVPVGVGVRTGSSGRRPRRRRWSRSAATCSPSRSRPTPSATRWSAPWSAPWWTWAGAAGDRPTSCGSCVRATASRPASRPLPTA